MRLSVAIAAVLFAASPQADGISPLVLWSRVTSVVLQERYNLTEEDATSIMEDVLEPMAIRSITCST
jgi:hypothetical protein